MKLLLPWVFMVCMLAGCGKSESIPPTGTLSTSEIGTETETAANSGADASTNANAAVAKTPAEEEQQQLKEWERLDTPIEASVIYAWTEAKDHVGETIGVEGTIVDTYNSGRACFLNFTKEWQGEFYIAVLGSHLGAFDSAPEQHFMNKRVRVVGKVKMYKGRPQIVVETPQHIQILN